MRKKILFVIGLIVFMIGVVLIVGYYTPPDGPVELTGGQTILFDTTFKAGCETAVYLQIDSSGGYSGILLPAKTCSEINAFFANLPSEVHKNGYPDPQCGSSINTCSLGHATGGSYGICICEPGQNTSITIYTWTCKLGQKAFFCSKDNVVCYCN